MGNAFLAVFGWMLRALAVLVVLGIGNALQYRYTHPNPVDASLMATGGGQLGYILGLVLEVVFSMAIYAIGSKLLKWRNKARAPASDSAAMPEK